MSGLARLARRVVRCYPRPWRRRYEQELAALLDDHAVSLSHVADLVWTCAGEWWRAGAENVTAPARAAFVLVRGLGRMAATLAAGLAIAGTGTLVAWGLREALGVPAWVRGLSALPFLSVMAVMCRVWLPGIWTSPFRYAVVSPWEKRIWVAALIVLSGAGQWGGQVGPDPVAFSFFFVLSLSAAVSLLSQPAWRQSDLDAARERLRQASASLDEARRVMWHLDDLQRQGHVSDIEFDVALDEERAWLESVKRWRAAVRRLEYSL